MEKLSALFGLFRKGSEIANAEAWKNGQITVNAVIAALAALVALMRAFGIEVPLDNDGVAAVAGGLFALTNMVFTIITSDRVGLPAKLPPRDEPGDHSAGPEANYAAIPPAPVGGEGFNAERGS